MGHTTIHVKRRHEWFKFDCVLYQTKVNKKENNFFIKIQPAAAEVTETNAIISATEINQYLFENGLVLSHLVKRKPSFEQQFLDLTNNN